MSAHLSLRRLEIRAASLTSTGLALALLGVTASCPAQAQTFYSDRTSFDMASTNLTTLTFENLIGTPAFPQNYSYGTGYENTAPTGITLDNLNFVGQNHYTGIPYSTSFLGPDATAGPGLEPGVFSLDGTTSLVGGRSSLAVTLPIGITSFGTDIGQANYGSPIRIDALVTLANSQSYSQVLDFTAGSKEFIGFTDAVPITTVTFTNPNDPLNSLPPNAIFDNVSFGSTAAVPEASTLISTGLLLCLGLGGLALSARRRKAQAGG